MDADSEHAPVTEGAASGAGEELVEAGEGALVAVGPLPHGIALPLPRRGASPLLDKVARANEHARDLALGRLAGWFPGYDFAAAAQNTDDRRFCVLDIGTELLDHLQAVPSLERFLVQKEHLFAEGGITFSNGEQPGHLPAPPLASSGIGAVRPPSGRLEVGGTAGYMARQWTTILNGIDRFEPRIAAVVADLMVAYGSRVNTNVYLSHGPARGFGPHWDTHDTIIVQVHGAKEWSVHNPLVLSAQRPWVGADISGDEIWRGVLEPGMALVVPRGWGHEVLGSDELTIHYTIGINRLEVHHLLERVAFEAGLSPLLRADVPFDLLAPIESYGGSPLEDPHGLAREVADLVTPELIDRAVATYRARNEARRFPPLVSTFGALALGRWDGVRLRMPATGGLTVAGEDATWVTFAYDNRIVRVPAAAADAVVALAASAPLLLADLPPVEIDGRDRRADLARDLVSANVVVLDDGSFGS